MKRLIVTLTALATVAVALAACGGDGNGGEALSEDEYSQTIAGTGTALEQAFEGVATEAQALDTSELSSVDDLDELMAELAGVVRGGVDSLNQSADDLEGVSPPEDAREAHDKLVEGLNLLAEDFEEFAQAVEDGEFDQIQDLAAGFDDIASSEAGQLLDEATGELEELGYDIDG